MATLKNKKEMELKVTEKEVVTIGIHTGKSQKDKSDIERHWSSINCSVRDAYKSGCSVYKQRAETEIREIMDLNDGYDYRILGAGSSMFSTGWVCRVDECVYLIVDTKTDRYAIPMNRDAAERRN